MYDRFAPTRLVATPQSADEEGNELPPQPVLPPEVVPLLEELLFRGVLQPWVRKRPAWGGYLVIAIAVATAVALRFGKIKTAIYDGNVAGVMAELWPAGFVAIMAAGYVAITLWPKKAAPVETPTWSPDKPRPRISPLPVTGAVYATSLLFASLHSGVWPTPVPLFGRIGNASAPKRAEAGDGCGLLAGRQR